MQSKGCVGVPAHAAALSHGHKALPCPMLPGAGGSCPCCRQPQGDGQAAGKQAAAAEAWPLLLLKGTGGGRQALGGWWGAGMQWAEPGMQTGAEGSRSRECCRAEPSLASPA